MVTFIISVFPILNIKTICFTCLCKQTTLASLKRFLHKHIRIMNKLNKVAGLGLTAVIAAIAIGLSSSQLAHHTHASALTIALLIGMLVGNTIYPRIAAHTAEGVVFSKKTLLQLGIILYGFKITFQQIGQVGWTGMLIDATVLCSTFFLAYYLGTRFFKLDSKTSILIGAGSAICGSSAILATETVVKADAAKVAVAVSTVVIFGTLAMFIYPMLFQLNHHLGYLVDAQSFGMFTGSTMHDVGQVVAAGMQMDENTAASAVITKMLRVMMLAPFLVCLSMWWDSKKARAHAIQGGQAPVKARITIPWFALLFIAVAGVNSLNILPTAVSQFGLTLDTWVLAMATAGLGLATHVKAIRQAGMKPLLLAGVMFAYLIFGGAAINHIIRAMF